MTPIPGYQETPSDRKFLYRGGDEMAEKQISFVKACLEYFGTGRYGRKVLIPEFQQLTRKNKEELRDLLIKEEGLNVAEIPGNT